MLCKLNLAIVLYGSIYPHQIFKSFIFWHENISIDHPTWINIKFSSVVAVLIGDFIYRKKSNKGSNMSARVLLNLLNELWKRDRMRDLTNILSRFCNKFNKFNNTGARTLDSVTHVTFKLIKNCIFGVET